MKRKRVTYEVGDENMKIEDEERECMNEKR